MHPAEWTPQRLIEVSGGYWSACAIHAGLKLDLFAALGPAPRPLEDLAAQTGCDRRGLGMLLDALTALGLLRKTVDGYAATPFTRERLNPTSPDYLGHILLHHHHLMAGWSRLPQAVCSGRPVRTSASHTDQDQERESFLLGMFNLAAQVAPHLVKQIDLAERRTLLDFGGGPGTYAIHFCLANPRLQATIFDLPTTRPFAEATVARYGLQERIRFEAGEYPVTSPAGGYDVVWLSHVLHGEGPQTCRAMLAQAVAALNPGGVILIHEFILDDDRSGPLFPALFSLNMLIGTDEGQAYSEAELTAMLKEAGLAQIQRLPLQLPGPSGVLAATR